MLELPRELHFHPENRVVQTDSRETVTGDSTVQAGMQKISSAYS